MWSQFVGLADAKARAWAQGLAVPALLALLCAIFAIVTIAGLFGALFWWLAPSQGHVAAALYVAGLAFFLAMSFMLPLLLRRRRKALPPPGASVQPASILPNLVAKTLPLLTPKQIVIGSALAALALGLAAMSRPSSEDRM